MSPDQVWWLGLVDGAIKDITPHLSSLLVRQSSVTSGGFLGFFASTSTKYELKAVPVMVVDCLKQITSPVLAGLSGYAVRKGSEVVINEFLENHYSSPVDFITQFSALTYDAKENVSRAFVLRRLRQILIQNDFDIQHLIEGATLADFPKLIQALNQFNEYISNHLRIIDSNKESLSPERFHVFLQEHYAHLSLNPEVIGVPAEHVCPITKKVMEHPVSLTDANGCVVNFEEKAITLSCSGAPQVNLQKHR